MVVLAAAPNRKPINVSAGALGYGLLKQDLVLSPQHRVLVSSKIVERMFAVSEVLVPFKKLLDIDGVNVVDAPDEVTNFHILFPEAFEDDFSPNAARTFPQTGKSIAKLVQRHKKNNRDLVHPEHLPMAG